MENTRASLLLRIRDPRDARAWGEFVDIYLPLLHRYALRRGLQDSDAAEVAQESLRRVVGAIPQFAYDQNRGSFRGWLLTIARNEIRRWQRRESRMAVNLRVAAGPDHVEDVASDPSAEAWEQEYQWHLFHGAAQRVEPDFRPATWQAFWRSVVDGEPVGEVATDLGLSVGAVYIARSRILARIRQEIAAIEQHLP